MGTRIALKDLNLLDLPWLLDQPIPCPVTSSHGEDGLIFVPAGEALPPPHSFIALEPHLACPVCGYYTNTVPAGWNGPVAVDLSAKVS